jgi:hypothetical protein
MADVRDELSIRRMVGALEAHDALGDGWRVLLGVVQQVELGDGRAHEEDLLSVGERRQHLGEESWFVVRVIVGPRLLRLRVPMNVVVRRPNGVLTRGFGLDVKDARLVLVDPDCSLSHEACVCTTDATPSRAESRTGAVRSTVLAQTFRLPTPRTQ